MLSKEASSTIFWVFAMNWLGIEPLSPRQLVNTLICCRTSPRKSSNTGLRQLGSLSWLKIIHVTSSPSSIYLWSTRSFCQSISRKKQSAKNNNHPTPAAGMLFYASSGIQKFTCEVDFFSWETSSAHYNFCLQNWTYF